MGHGLGTKLQRCPGSLAPDHVNRLTPYEALVGMLVARDGIGTPTTCAPGEETRREEASSAPRLREFSAGVGAVGGDGPRSAVAPTPFPEQRGLRKHDTPPVAPRRRQLGELLGGRRDRLHEVIDQNAVHGQSQHRATSRQVHKPAQCCRFHPERLANCPFRKGGSRCGKI
jgi:hypothetical protein